MHTRARPSSTFLQPTIKTNKLFKKKKTINNENLSLIIQPFCNNQPIPPTSFFFYLIFFYDAIDSAGGREGGNQLHLLISSLVNFPRLHTLPIRIIHLYTFLTLARPPMQFCKPFNSCRTRLCETYQ